MKKASLVLAVAALAFGACQKEQRTEGSGVIYVESLKDKNKLVTYEEYVKAYYAQGVEKDQPVTRSNKSCWIPGKKPEDPAVQGTMCMLGGNGCTIPTTCVPN